MARDIYQEMQSRGSQPQQQQQGQRRKPVDIYEAMKISNAAQNPQPDNFQEKHPYLYKAGEYLTKNPTLAKGVNAVSKAVEPFQDFIENSGAPEFSGGLLEGLGNTAISMANLPLNVASGISGKNLKGEHLDFEKYMKDGGGIPHLAGNIVGPTLFAGGAIGRLSEAQRPQGYLGILSDILRGAGIGYATGENSQGERGLGAAVGGIFGGLRGISNPQTAQRIVTDMNNARRVFSQRYDGLFNEAGNSGIHGVQPTTINNRHLRDIFNNASRKYTRALNRFSRTNSLEDAHRAQSDLGKFISHMDEIAEESALTSEQHRAVRAAVRTQNTLRRSINNTFNRSDRPDLAREYQNITREYAEEVIPYTTNKNIRKYAAGKMSSSTLSKKLLKDHVFSEALGGRYPELQANKIAKNIGKAGAYIGGIGTAGFAGNRAFEKLMGK